MDTTTEQFLMEYAWGRWLEGANPARLLIELRELHPELPTNMCGELFRKANVLLPEGGFNRKAQEEALNKNPKGTLPAQEAENCWKDKLGKRLEANGVNSGCIFKFDWNLREDDLLPGGIVVSNLKPGQVPEGPWDILGCFIQRKCGEEIRLSPGNPLLLSHWISIVFELERN